MHGLNPGTCSICRARSNPRPAARPPASAPAGGPAAGESSRGFEADSAGCEKP